MMLKLKYAKRDMDYDATLLSNRINMLQNEEDRIMKKIDKTRKRAEQIKNIR
jgi:chaperonin cofactor prefoldin